MTMIDPSSYEFVPGEDDPVEYDYSALRHLIGICEEPMRLALESLRRNVYEFPSMEALNRDALDVELLYRQCIPAACIGMKLGLPVGELARYLELFAICQTSILNHIDRHLDLSSSHTLRDPALLLADVHGVMCYGVAQLYTGILSGSLDSRGVAALREMSGVSRLVIQSMYDNYQIRYREDQLMKPDRVLESYKDPIRSRHLGSGFYASSIMGLYAYFTQELPAHFAAVISEMRKLRQRTDELADLYEDSMTGLITYPIARLLALPRYHDDAASLLRNAWKRAKEVISDLSEHAGRASFALLGDRVLQEFYALLLDMLEKSDVLAVCYAESSELWFATRRIAIRQLPSGVADVVLVVLDLKRALLERMVRSHWDDGIEHSFLDILGSVTGEIYD